MYNYNIKTKSLALSMGADQELCKHSKKGHPLMLDASSSELKREGERAVFLVLVEKQIP